MIKLVNEHNHSADLAEVEEGKFHSSRAEMAWDALQNIISTMQNKYFEVHTSNKLHLVQVRNGAFEALEQPFQTMKKYSKMCKNVDFLFFAQKMTEYWILQQY